MRYSALDGLNEFLSHIIFGNVLNPIVIRLLKRDDYSKSKQLLQVFDMYEDFASGDTETQNLLQVTLLEILWDEAITYERAMKLMGKKRKRYGIISTAIFISREAITAKSN